MADRLEHDPLNFITDGVVRRWVARHAVVNGFESPLDFVQHLLRQNYAQAGGYLEPDEEVTDEWRRWVEGQRRRETSPGGHGVD